VISLCRAKVSKAKTIEETGNAVGRIWRKTGSRKVYVIEGEVSGI
jgi:hypothetical protein